MPVDRKTKVLFITNPNAGTERAKAIQKAIDTYMDADRFHAKLMFTEYPGHGTKLAKAGIAEGYEIITAVGGDGTVNDIVSGMRGNTDVTLAILPKGSGNGLARSLGIPFQWKKNLELFCCGHIRKIDIGQVNDQFFLSNTGTGFDSLVISDFVHSKKRGFISYLAIIIKNLLHYKPLIYTLQTEKGTFREKAFMLTVANGPQLGYGFKIAPEAVPDDGLLDLVILYAFPWYAIFGIVVRAFTGSIHKSKYLKTMKTKQLTITQAGMRMYQYDGESSSCKDILDIRIHPGALKVLVPKSTVQDSKL